MCVVMAAGFVACRSPRVFEESFLVMGTVCTVKVLAEGPSEANIALCAIRQTLRATETAFSAHDPAGRLTVINRQAAAAGADLSAEEAWLLARAVACSDMTGGAFDVTFRPLWELWKKCERENRLPTDDEVHAARERVDYRALVISPDGRNLRFARAGISLDLGGIAKGAALLACRDAANAPGIGGLLVNLGGDVLALGREREGGWVVGIQNPDNPYRIACRFKALNKLALTSGVYQRFVTINGRRYHHILDANTGFPAEGLLSVTIVLDPDRESYLPSLAVFLMGLERAESFLAAHPEYGYYLITAEGAVRSRLP